MLKFQRIEPAAPLRQFIQGYWQIESSGQSQLLELIPDGFPEIVFNLENNIKSNAGEEGFLCYPQVGIIGQLTKKNSELLSSNYSALYVKLYPWTPYSLFRIPFWKMNDQVVDLQSVTNCSSYRQLGSDLRSAGNLSLSAFLLDTFFLKKLAAQKIETPFLSYAVQQIFQTNGMVSIESLTENIHASRRYVEKIFKKQIGMSPKQYARLIRVKKASILLSDKNFNGNIYSVSSALNYYDQSHFLKDFKAVVGCTPTQFLRQQVDFPIDEKEQYLGQWDYS